MTENRKITISVAVKRATELGLRSMRGNQLSTKSINALCARNPRALGAVKPDGYHWKIDFDMLVAHLMRFKSNETIDNIL